MPTDVVPMTTGTFKLSEINFYCAPGRSNGPIIRLGYISEILTSNLRGMGLLGRRALNEFERGLIGNLGGRVLDSPYGFLSDEFDRAWESAEPGEALEYLCDLHKQSVRFEAPVEESVPRHLFVDGTAVRSLVLGHLVSVLEEASYDLIPLSKKDLAQAGPATDTGLLTEAA